MAPDSHLDGANLLYDSFSPSFCFVKGKTGIFRLLIKIQDWLFCVHSSEPGVTSLFNVLSVSLSVMQCGSFHFHKEYVVFSDHIWNLKILLWHMRIQSMKFLCLAPYGCCHPCYNSTLLILLSFDNNSLLDNVFIVHF